MSCYKYIRNKAAVGSAIIVKKMHFRYNATHIYMFNSKQHFRFKSWIKGILKFKNWIKSKKIRSYNRALVQNFTRISVLILRCSDFRNWLAIVYKCCKLQLKPNTSLWWISKGLTLEFLFPIQEYIHIWNDIFSLAYLWTTTLNCL